MKQSLFNKEIAVLECLEHAKKPLGSWNLVEMLEKRGVYSSSATVGRVLNALERMGYLEKSGMGGRLITPSGLQALSEARLQHNIDMHQQKLGDMILVKTLDDYLAVLHARRAIECETARLAAGNITVSELKELARLIKEQTAAFEAGESIAQLDILFHKGIAAASRNKVLEALYAMLFPYGQQTPVFEHMRKQVTTGYLPMHQNIYNALKKHDPQKAEEAMLMHIEGMIQDVMQYYHLFFHSQQGSE